MAFLKSIECLGSGGAETERALKLLRRAAATKAEPIEAVYGALLFVEQAQLPPQGWQEKLDGDWQLLFAAPNKTVPAWSYIPVNEDARLGVAAKTFDLVSDVGPLNFAFLGGFEWGPARLHPAVDFAFEQLRLSAFGRQLFTTGFGGGKRKTYTFFLVEEGIAAARSSGGSVCLLKRRQ